MSRTAPGGTTHEHTAPERKTKKRVAPLALLCALAALTPLAAGCGIRATSVPVDAGAAPSRVGCVLPGDKETPNGTEDTSATRIYLVCGSRVAPIDRQVDMPDGRSSAERLPVARKLLEELKSRPTSTESDAGFETAVPKELTITGARDGDPDEALRLSVPLNELPSYALAQLVCTYADTAAADANNAVVLGGPADGDSNSDSDKGGSNGSNGNSDGNGGNGDDGNGDSNGGKSADGEGADEPLQRYECGTALRTRPEAAETAGTRV